LIELLVFYRFDIEFTFAFFKKGEVLKTRFVIDSILIIDFTDNVFVGYNLDMKNPLSPNHSEIKLDFDSKEAEIEKLNKIAQFYASATLHARIEVQNVPSTMTIGTKDRAYQMELDAMNGNCLITYPLKQQYLAKYFAKFELLLHYPNPFLKKQMQDEIDADLSRGDK
jgi:hypothetical protein